MMLCSLSGRVSISELYEASACCCIYEMLSSTSVTHVYNVCVCDILYSNILFSSFVVKRDAEKYAFHLMLLENFEMK